MHIKDLFTVPAGKKVNERMLARVLASSICSILLCMVCFVGTTWAWFIAGVEDTGNVIRIGTPSATVTVNGASFTSGASLPGGAHVLEITHANAADAFDRKSTLYVTFSVDQAVKGWVTLNEENSYTASIEIAKNADCAVSWTVSWLEPDNARPITGAIDLRPTETEPVTEATEPTKAETEPVTETTVPAQSEPDSTEGQP